MEQRFCGPQPLWDTNLVWNAETPELGPCLRQLSLTITPCVIFLILLPIDLLSPGFFTMSRNLYPIPWSTHMICRFLVAVAAFVISVTEVGFTLVTEDGDISALPVIQTWTPVITMVTHALLMFLIIRNKCKGLVRSGPTWVFAFVSLLASCLDYYHIFFVKIEVPDHTFISMLSRLPVMAFLLILSSIADEPIIPAKGRVSPRDLCSFPSYFTYSFVDKISLTGWRKAVTYEDLHPLVPMNTTSFLGPKMTAALFKETADGSLENTGVTKALVKVFAGQLIHSAIAKLAMDLTDLMPPLLLKALLTFCMTPDTGSSGDGGEYKWHGYVIAVAMLAATISNNLAQNQYYDTTTVMGIRAKTGLVTCIYRKSLRLGSSVRQETTIGEIVNLMSVDADRFSKLSEHLHTSWAAVLQIGICIFLLYQEIGISAFAGVAVLVLVLPINALVAAILETGQKKQMKQKDQRVKLMNEILSGIRVIKMYGWEEAFMTMVRKMRTREIKFIGQVAYSNSVFTFMWTMTPVLVAVSTFTVYVLIDETHVLNPQKVFFSLSLFNLMRMPLTNLPYLMTNLVSCYVSVKRLNRFFSSPDLVQYVTRFDDNDDDEEDEKDSPALIMKHATLTWTTGTSAGPPDSPVKAGTTTEESRARSDFQLTLDLKIQRNSLTAVVGNVGSGKSSFISSLLGEMQLTSGIVSINNDLKTIAYVPQQAWIMNDSFRNNILFGSEYNEDRYNEVLDYCQLLPDLQTLASGDETEIGEKGINMSGGQKQRLSLARACYSNADLFLFDDPLSALDSHVAKQVFHKVLSSKTGLLKNKTRILVTNNVSVLPDCQEILVLKNGRVTESGTYSQLEERGDEFSAFLEEFANRNQDEENEDEVGDGINTTTMTRTDRVSRSGSVMENIVSARTESISIVADEETGKKLVKITEGNNSGTGVAKQKEGKEKGKGEQLIVDESHEVGRVKWTVFKTYFSFMSTLPVVLISLISNQACEAGGNYWLSIWSQDGIASGPNSGTQDPRQRNIRVAVYAGLGIGSALCLLIASLALAKGSLQSATRLHQDLLHRILRSPMSFFETTPIGRIVNRFSKDMDSIDIWLLDGCLFFSVCALQLTAAVLMIEIAEKWFFVVAIPLFLIFLLTQRLYIATSRQLRRLESTTRSPIYSQFSESLAGVSSIRSYGAVTRFESESDDRIDCNQTCAYTTWVCNRWLSTRLMFVGNVVVFLVSLFAVAFKDPGNSGVSGLAVSYSMSISNLLNWFVQVACFTETELVSVERVLEYSNVSSEAEWTLESEDGKPPANWPQDGYIVFHEYETRYREGLDPVVKKVSVDIPSGMKVGICGRTGAGKSTMTQSLLRIIEATHGKIVIDGVDIAKIGLHDLRSRLTIIPQDPVLFSGTLRLNLDPFDQKTDQQLWRSLELSHLKDFVLLQGLEFPVSEGGENLSLGQRQLVCLARALLRKSKILIMDEATAAVDLQTDALIQSTVRQQFADCTILTIAHRLNTIIDSDKVLVMDQGLIVEFEDPGILLKNKDSLFHALAADAGLV